MSCENCIFYKPLKNREDQIDKLIKDNNDISKLGFCFRFPPKSDMNKEYRIRNIYPIVYSSSVCGEYHQND